MSILRYAVTLVLLVIFANSGQAGTLDDVKQRGRLNCGVGESTPGFSEVISGQRVGFDVDYCKAIAAAIFGNESKVMLKPLTIDERFTALKTGKVDVLVRNTSWTGERDVVLGLSFAGINFFDGQGMMVRKALGIRSMTELDGATICVLEGTSHPARLADYFARTGQTYSPVVVSDFAPFFAAYSSGQCDGLTYDASGLAAIRADFLNDTEHVILPELISREPMSIIVRQGDDNWRDVLAWVHNALLIAEFHGITKANAATAALHADPEAKKLLGLETNPLAARLGLGSRWARNAIRAVGNYGEIFDRHLGKKSRFKMLRGPNALSVDGGLHFPPPLF